MDSQYSLTVYYDASCPICRSEILNIKVHDERDNLCLVDCSSPDFCDARFRREGISREDMMARLHARDLQGVWFKGADAMGMIYRTAGIRWAADLWERHTLLRRIYPWFARNRQILSLTGIPLLFVIWRKWQVWRLYRRSQACKNGRCALQTHKEE